MMRIITGTAKGTRLKTLEGDATRPTAERVKEAVFSMLQGDIEGREVLDLFAGSGQMSLEALSRGAKSAVMLDSSPQAIKVINENADRTHLMQQCLIRREDYLSYINRNSGKQFDIIFLDPPYNSGFYSIALKNLYAQRMLKSTTLIICESGTDTIFQNEPDLAVLFNVIKQSRYSNTYITILSPIIETKEVI